MSDFLCVSEPNPARLIVRLRYCQRTRAYAQRRTAEGLSKREIIRCLKRYIAREIYHALRADLTADAPS